jgi:hypothetical protein
MSEVEPDARQIDLFWLDPADEARPVSTIHGPPRWEEGFGAGLRAWCGPLVGWRDFGDLVSPERAVIVRHAGRLSISLTFDLGAHVLPRALRDRVAAQEGEEEEAAR